MPRTNFTNDQKAEIFALDRATCSYSGRSLWISDYGIDPRYSVDWVDHVDPASLGGTSSVENGAAACWVENYLRGNAKRRVLLFHRGIPMAGHTFHVGRIDPDVLENLLRFRHLDPSDWYLNRAMWHVWISLVYEYDRSRGRKRARGFDYYARAAVKMLSTWRRRMDRGSVADLKTRNLLRPHLEPDQAELLSVRALTTPEAIVRLMKALYPSFEEAATALELLAASQRLSDVDVVLDGLHKLSLIPTRLRASIGTYATQLHQLMSAASESSGRAQWTHDTADGMETCEEDE